MASADLLQLTPGGLFCPAGNFFIDPWRGAERAIITHAHSDHARPGSARYLTAAAGERVLRFRLGASAVIDSLPYGEPLHLGGVRVSLHPAGHILGSCQVRLERKGEVAVVSGDYKTAADPTCDPFEPLACDTFVTESTFGLPVYRWPSPVEIQREILDWWRANQQAGRTSLLYAYSLGKAQRLIAGLEPLGEILTHGAVERFNVAYRAAGVQLPPTRHAGATSRSAAWQGALVVAPPVALGSPWARKFDAATGFLSGWMQIRGARRRRAVDRGFVLSDHADWPGLLIAIEATGAHEVWVTHGYTAVLARWLSEKGLAARVLSTRFEGERDDNPENVLAEEPPAGETAESSTAQGSGPEPDGELS